MTCPQSVCLKSSSSRILTQALLLTSDSIVGASGREAVETFKLFWI